MKRIEIISEEPKIRGKDEITDVTDVTQGKSRKGTAENRILVLVVESPPELAGKEFEILSPGILGRSTQATITIPEKSVSRKHFFFEPEPENHRVYIKDLNSTNGTFVNGAKLHEIHVKPGDKISCGRVVMRLESRSKDEHIARKKLKTEAEIDPLTQLYNRRVLENEMRKLIISEEHFSIIFMDIDNLKRINDTMGHRKGDEALMKISHAVKRSIRETDIAGRYGGDEFLIILKKASKIIAKKIVERIDGKIKEIDEVGKNKIPLTFSFGIAEFPYDGEDYEILIKHADNQLYNMKRMKK